MPNRVINGLVLCLMLYALPCFTLRAMPPFKKGTDTAAVNRLFISGKTQADHDSAIHRFRQAVEISVNGDYFLGAAKGLCAIGSRYSDMGNYAMALDYGKQALPYAERSGDRSQIAFCYNLFAVIYLMQGDYVQASGQFLKALDVLKGYENENKETLVTIYNNLAVLNGRLGQEDKKHYYLDQAEKFARDPHISPFVLGGALVNKANYFMESYPDSAIRYYMEVLAIANSIDSKNKNKKTRMQALALVNLGAAYLQKKEYERAVSYSRQGVDIIKDTYPFMAAEGSYILGEALRNLKRYKEAEAVLTAALSGNTALKLRDQTIVGYVTLSNVYKDTKQYKKAADCLDSLVALKDSLVTAEKIKAVRQLENKYDLAEKDRQILQNELLIAQQQTNITRKNTWIGSISVGLFLLIALSAGIYFTNRQKQVSIIRSLKQENTISILKGVVQGEENERIRLARDLHDGIGGMLSATKMRFMSLRHENESLVRSPRYLEAMGLLDIMGDEIRKTSHNLMPEVLLKQDLADALRNYCSNMQAGTSLHIDFQSFGSFQDLSNDFKLNVYRIVQELLKNTIQHAKATNVIIQLMMLEDYLTINVEDNGKGFDTTETKDGIGLNNLKTRVLSQEGHYTLKSEPGKGTMVYIEFATRHFGNT